MESIFFATNNPYKLDEVKAIAAPYKLTIEPFDCNIRELQTMDRRRLIRHKTVEAFTLIGYPVLVDHASLVIDSLNGMPGTLTQLFWDKLEERICDIVLALGNPNAKAISTVGYCDGKKLYDNEGIVEGHITEKPVGERKFQWDTIFIPEGKTKTYAEMDIPEKNAVSQRKIAFENLFREIIKS